MTEITFQSVPHMFFESCAKFDKPNAVLVKQDGVYKPFTHKFFKQRVNNFARGLMAMGFEPKQHLAIMAETRFEWAIADLAILSAGGISVPVYQTLSAKEVEYILHDSQSVGVVVSDQDQVEKIMTVKKDLPMLKYIIVMDQGSDLPADVKSMKEIEGLGSGTDNEEALLKRTADIEREQLMTLIYTSGTTGPPKGVMLSHHNLLSNVEGVIDAVPCNQTDTHLSHLPLCHVLERMSGFYLMVCCGVTIAYAENMKTIQANLVEVQPTVMISVPRLFEKIYAGIKEKAASSGLVKRGLFKWALAVAKEATPYFVNGKPLPGTLGVRYRMADKVVFSKIREKTGGRLKYLVSGGAPLSKDIGEFFLGIGIKILEGYGLTETSPVLTCNTPEHLKPGTVGPPISNVEIRIAEDGEILARGPNVMMGYYNNDKATEEAIVDGWFHTGDIGVIDDDGFLRITDRKKEIIVTSGGKNVAPQPIESALKLSPYIENAVVIGDRRNYITALIVPPWETVAKWSAKQQWSSDPEVLSKHAPFRELLMHEIDYQMKDFARYEKVKKFEIISQPFDVETGELTPSLKIKRKVINKKFEALIDRMYEEES